jgi:hypothetical protein
MMVSGALVAFGRGLRRHDGDDNRKNYDQDSFQ